MTVVPQETFLSTYFYFFEDLLLVSLLVFLGRFCTEIQNPLKKKSFSSSPPNVCATKRKDQS
jgi:hypothetical protein